MIRRPFSTAMIDMLLCTVIALFIAVAPPVKTKDGVTPTADFQITMRWERGVDIDMDLYLMDPTGKVVWYGWKHQGNINVDRDDLGKANDTDDNVETFFIREPVDGDYYVTLHTFNLNGRAPTGDVYVAIQDRHGVQPFAPVKVVMPPEKAEVAVVKFTIELGKVVHAEASNVLLRSTNRAKADPATQERENGWRGR
jgi:hypothetical protein